MCKQDKILMFPKDSQFTVYCKECWWSDGWDPMQYGRDYDFSKPFFQQWRELLNDVPRMGKIQQGENPGSEYTNRVDDQRNCYLVYGSTSDEFCRYGYWNMFSKECVDCLNIFKCERCYDCIDCRLCYNVAFGQESASCRDSWFLFNCQNVSDSFGCVNLRNKQYCLFNEQLTKEEYQKRIAALDLADVNNVAKQRQQFEEFKKTQIVPAVVTHQSVDVSGNWIESCRNAHDSFNVTGCDNVRHCFGLVDSKDSMDYTSWGNPGERVYESVSAGRQIGNSKFLNECWDQVIDTEYSMNCHGVTNLFGCIGLRKKEYCILNKQYTKEEYEVMVEKIKKQMEEVPYVDAAGRSYGYGEFYPVELSMFAYDETTAQEYFPLTKEQAEEVHFPWKQIEPRKYQVTIEPKDLPERTDDMPEDLAKEIIGCEHSGACTQQCTSAFKLLAEDVALSKRTSLPLPRLCPNCRHFERLAKRNPLNLWSRSCQCSGSKSHQHGETQCQNQFETSYGPDPRYAEGSGEASRPEKVYCVDFYQQEVA